MTSLLKCIVFVFISSSIFAQTTQVVSGKISDELNNPLSSASIQLLNKDTTIIATSDGEGMFTLTTKAARYLLTVSFTGFATYSDELLVIAGKSIQLNIKLKESTTQLKDVEVSGSSVIDYPSSYSISIEKTMRVPANFFDPVRMATSLPGVVNTNDQGNSISIKGYSPNALLWRLQGLDIVNPNHLANAGTLSDKPMANGGGVSIISSQVLDKTNFYTGALPIQYGNALSGALDMSLRPGNKSNREHTVQASLIGIDLATEGPLGKRQTLSPLTPEGGTPTPASASYLINYRYSTIGLLSNLGVNFGDEKINFQDLTFHLDFDQKKGKHTSVFGFGGLSSNNFNHKPEAEWKTEKDRHDIDFKGAVYGLGFTSTLYSNERNELKVGLSYSGQNQERQSQSADVSNTLQQFITDENYNSDRKLASALLSYSRKLSSQFSLQSGFNVTSYTQNLNVVTNTYQPSSGYPYSNLSGNVNGILWQPYINSIWRAKWATLNAGLRYVYFGYDGATSLEPRLSITSPIFKGMFSVSYGITSQVQQTQTYLSPLNPVHGLGLSKAHQFNVSYDKIFSNRLSFRLNAYYHKLFQIPSASSGSFSTINQADDFVFNGLSSTGFGKNKGIDFSLEKKFISKWYFLLGGSLYNSSYAGKTSSYLSSRYNGKFTVSLSGGKEWNLRKNVFGVHTRILYLGGLRQQAINTSSSETYGTTVYNDNGLFPVSLPDYYRMDLRVSWRKNKPGYTRTLSIDIQNLTNHLNVGYYYFDTFLKKIETKFQLGIIPVLVYRIDF